MVGVTDGPASRLDAAGFASAADRSTRVGDVVPSSRHPTAALVGPCYDTRGLARVLGISQHAIETRSRAGTLLACRTESGSWRYPALQFDGRGSTLPHLRELLEVLAGPDGRRRWRAARWLAAPAPYLPDAVSAAVWLRDGGDPAPVLAAARADAQRWAE